MTTLFYQYSAGKPLLVFKISGDIREDVNNYKHHVGVTRDTIGVPVNPESFRITEAQYIRLKKIALSKLLKN